MAEAVHGQRVTTIEGQETSLARYRGNVLLIVNTATRCGFRRQLGSLERLYQTYRSRGLVILAFPANNFLRQEPGTDQEIRNACAVEHRTTFPLFSKISVRGGSIDPLYDYLTKRSGFPGGIRWNFTKFLVDREGRVVARFEPATDPLDREVIQTVERLLDAGGPEVAAPERR